MIIIMLTCPACGFSGSQLITVHNINDRLSCSLCSMRRIAAAFYQVKIKGVIKDEAQKTSQG